MGAFTNAGISLFELSTFIGNISNAGVITARTGIQICTCGMSTFAGSIINSGTINAAAVGIIAEFVSTFTGGITNSGTIAAGGNGILVGGIRTFAGGISNSGTISAGVGIGIGGFIGNVSSFAGGIANSGTISAFEGILVGGPVGNVSNFTGGISNSGTIISTSSAGIVVAAVSTFSGGIANSGTITGRTGIVVAASTFLGTISNIGTIIGNVGINLTTGSVSVFDSGTINVGAGGTAVQFSGGGNTFTLGPGYSITGFVIGAGADTFQLGGTGNGTFDLSQIGGSQQYQGFTTFNVVGGTWTVSNTFGQAQPWIVNGGTLAGTGTLSSVNVNNGGTLEPGLPGTAGGTLMVAGNLAMASAAAYLVNLSPSVTSLTTIKGTATLAGAFDVNSSGGAFTNGTKYTVLTATGGRSGTFSSLAITGSFGSMMPVVTYDADDVFLTLAPASLLPHLPPGTPQNDINVANAITIANLATPLGGTPPPAFQNLFSLSPTQLVNALTQLSGEAATGAQESDFQLVSSFLSLLTGPSGGTSGGGPALPFAPERADGFPSDVALAYASVLKAPVYKAPVAYEPRWTAWGAAFGGANSTGGDPAGVGSHDMTAHAGAVAAGIDYHVAPDAVVGVALAGGGTNWSLSAGLGGGHSDAFLAGLYGSKLMGQAYVSGALTYACNWMSTSRTIAVAGADTLNASFNAQSFGARLEGGYRIPSALAFGVTPYAALQAQSFRSPAYSESGSLGAPDPFALSYASQTATVERSELGSRFDHMFAQAGGGSVDVFGRLAWAHDWQSNPNLSATFIGLPAATFVVNGASPPSNLALLTAGAEWRWRNGWSFMARLDGELANRSDTYTGTARVKYSW